MGQCGAFGGGINSQSIRKPIGAIEAEGELGSHRLAGFFYKADWEQKKNNFEIQYAPTSNDHISINYGTEWTPISANDAEGKSGSDKPAGFFCKADREQKI
jgi:hypothetical protein